jgi:hypothetical protein
MQATDMKKHALNLIVHHLSKVGNYPCGFHVTFDIIDI